MIARFVVGNDLTGRGRARRWCGMVYFISDCNKCHGPGTIRVSSTIGRGNGLCNVTQKQNQTTICCVRAATRKGKVSSAPH